MTNDQRTDGHDDGDQPADRATPATARREQRGRPLWPPTAFRPCRAPSAAVRVGGTIADSNPAGMPNSMTNPATGTASRLAGSDTSGRRWNTSQLGSATPSLGTERDRQRHAQPQWAGQSSASAGATMQTPAVAPVDSQNPTDHTSIGSTSTRIVTVHASSRATDCWRPRTNDEQPSMAMTPARSTDGSNRVSAMNQPISPMRGRPPPPRPQPAEQRRCRGQDEGHVLAGHRSEV